MSLPGQWDALSMVIFHQQGRDLDRRMRLIAAAKSSGIYDGARDRLI